MTCLFVYLFVALLAGFTEEVAYVSGPLDARGGVCVCAAGLYFGPQANFLLFFTCYEIRNLIKDLVMWGLLNTFLF